MSTSTIKMLLIVGKIEPCYRLGAPAVYLSVVNSHQAFKTHRAALHFWRDRLGHKTLEDITREDIIQGRDELSKTRKPATVHKYMSIITHSLNIAVKEYGWLHQSVASTVSRPPLPPIKVRFLSDDERNRLLEECKKSKNPYVYALVSLAIYLGLRRGSL